jgi:hypothetical protein
MSGRSNSAPFLLLLLVLLAPAPLSAQAPLQLIRERIFSFDMRIDPQPVAVAANTGAAGVAWRADIVSRFPQGGGLNGIRVHVLLDAPLAAGQTLRVLDRAGAVVDQVSGSATDLVRELWSREVPDGAAVVELSRSAPGRAPGATLSYAYHVTPTEQQAISGKNQLMKVADAPPRIRQLGKSVARLRFMVAGAGQATCTAFLVGKRLILTNQHCISNDSERASALVEFNYDIDGSTVEGIGVATVLATDAGLDYALLGLAADPPSGVGRLYFAPDTWQWAAPPAEHPLVIVQHPSGRPKEVSMADCKLSGLDRIGAKAGDACDFGHLCDTLGGSSGSPVMDWQSGFVVGLHHFGFVDGSNDPVNQAVVHKRILADILLKDKAAHAEIVQPRPQP